MSARDGRNMWRRWYLHPPWVNRNLTLFLTLNKPGFSGHLKAGGGRNQPGYVIDVLHCCFSVKSLFHGLKWKFRSSVVHRSNNHSSMLNTFAVRLLGSNLFCPENLLVLGRKILKIHYLWPTCTICTSNESWKHTKCKSGVEIAIWLNFWVKNQFSKIFASIFKKNFFLKLKFFKNFQIQPPKIFFLIILNT